MKVIYRILIVTLFGVLFLTSCQENGNPKSSSISKNESDSKVLANHFDIIMAQIINEEFVFVHNINSKVSSWEDVINKGASMNTSFFTISIEQEDDMYYLVGIDSITPATSKIRLILDAGNFYEYKYSDGTGGSGSTGLVVTCSGCTSKVSTDECEPKFSNQGWYCTACSQGTCTKSSSAVSGGVISRRQ
ncbi:MAG: hypothetical protein QM503_00745 [Bacteroidota bacterium]